MGEGYGPAVTDEGDIHRLLAGRRRRYVLSYLTATSDDVVSRADLAAHLLVRDPEATCEERVALHLHHVSLPILDDGGLVDYDPEGGEVRYLGHPLVESLLDETTTNGPPDGTDRPVG